MTMLRAMITNELKITLCFKHDDSAIINSVLANLRYCHC